MVASEEDRDPSRSVINKAMTVMECFTPKRHTMSLSEIARAAGLPKTTAFRLVSVLTDIGCLERDGASYSIGVRMHFVINGSAEAQLRLAAQPYLHELHRLTSNTLHLAVLRGDDVVYVEKLASRDGMPTPTSVAGTMPAHLTGVGKALLAHQPQELLNRLLARPLRRMTSRSLADPARLDRALRSIRSTGVAVDESEAVVGLSCMAVPVWSHGRVVAALSLSYPTSASIVASPEHALRVTALAIGRATERLVG